MVGHGTGAAPGFQDGETFDNTLPFAVFVRRLAPLAVMLLLVTWLIVALLLEPTGLPGVFYISLVVAVLFIAAMSYLRKRQFDATWGSSTLELSPQGAVETIGEIRTTLEWSAIAELGKAGLITPMEPVTQRRHFFGDTPLTKAAVGAARAAARRADQDALVGAGGMSIGPEAGKIHRTAFDQNMKQRPVDPASGRPIVSVLLSHYDPNWRVGRIGEWVRAYRPDLLP